MGIKRGTIPALGGIGGALIEMQLNLIGGILVGQFSGFTFPPFVNWGVGCFVGVVAGDIFTALTGGDVSTGKWVGIGKGLIAAGAGIGGLYFSDGSFLWFVASVWITTVLGDFFGL